MATTKVSALSAKTSLAGSEELLINDSGTSKKVTATNLLAGATVADGSISTAKIADDAVTADKLANSINTDIATGVTANTTANAALPKTGGAMTGAITTNSTFDGRDVATDGAKLDGIEASATADQTDAEIRAAVEAASDSNVFTDADHSKLNAIEASADVTDATNVTAAGALMDSEVTNLAQVKAFDSSDYATAAQGTTADAALPKAGGAMTGNIVMADDTSIGIADDAERIEFDGAGDIGFLGCNVGIGTSTVPTSPENNAGPILQIGDGSNAMSSIVLHEDGNKWEVVSNDDLIIQDESVVRQRLGKTGDITFYDASQAEKVIIKNDGKVGIGTSSPASTLEINGNAIAKTDTDTSNTGSVTLDFGANQNFVLTLTGNVTLANPSTEVVGQSGFITFIQDGTGSRTVALGTDYETAGGSGLTLTSTASATDIVPYVVVAAGRILLGTPQLAFA